MAGGEECFVAVLDVDGVLLRRGIGGEVEVRRLGVEVARSLAEAGYRLHVHTGRRPGDRGLVLSLLREAGFPLSSTVCLMFRGERGVGEVEWKLSALQEALEREGCVGEIHDDNPEVLEAARRMVGGAVLHWDEYCGLLYGSTAAPQCRRRL